MELVDVHAHLFDRNLSVTPAEAIACARAVGVTQCVVPGLDVTTSHQALKIADQFPGICFATIGVHPSEVLIPEFNLLAVMEMLGVMLDRSATENGNAATSLPVGIGEIGIDYYHYDRDKTRSIQREALATQLAVAVEHDLPVIVHGRSAYEDVLDVIRAHPGSRGLLHSFEAPYDVAKAALDLGWIVSFTALVTYPTHQWLHDVIRRLPLDRFTVETDSPYLPPQSRRIVSNGRGAMSPTPQVIGQRGRNNQPAYVVETVETIAKIRSQSFEQIALATSVTARQLFQIPHSNLTS